MTKTRVIAALVMAPIAIAAILLLHVLLALPAHPDQLAWAALAASGGAALVAGTAGTGRAFMPWCMARR